MDTAVRTIVDEDLLGRLRQFKFNLYLANQTDLIPDVHVLEEILTQILVARAGDLPLGDEFDIETQRHFAEAEEQMLRRDYHRAEATFYRLAQVHAGTRVSALSWYHLGDICYSFHGDFPEAQRCYEQALTPSAIPLFPPEILSQIERRLALLSDTAAEDHLPLRLLRQAEAAPPGSALGHYRRLLLDHPDSMAVVEGISSLAERAIREVPEAPEFPFEAIDLLRHYQRQPRAAHRALAQLRLADIVYHRLRDLPQALIEYGQVEVEPDDDVLEPMVRDRIAQILDRSLAAQGR
jgi:tetratricopeptide (TPR) repeat protein